ARVVMVCTVDRIDPQLYRLILLNAKRSGEPHVDSNASRPENAQPAGIPVRSRHGLSIGGRIDPDVVVLRRMVDVDKAAHQSVLLEWSTIDIVDSYTPIRGSGLHCRRDSSIQRRLSDAHQFLT